MNILSFIGTTPGAVAAVPMFEQGKNHDSTDLQIRSLLYLFRRLRINKLSAFLDSEYKLKYLDGKQPVIAENEHYHLKLDALYNLPELKRLLTEDEYRCTVDYAKNKFRSFCILSSLPSANLSRPSSPTKGKSNSERFENGFPVFKDDKDREARNFKFIVLPLHEVTQHQICQVLATSDIYWEHRDTVDTETRYQFAQEILKNIVKDKRVPNAQSAFDITEEEKSYIIRYYLRKVARTVQLTRIYEEYLKHYNPPSVPSSPTKSPRKVTSSSVLPSALSSTTTVTMLQNSSPTKVAPAPKLSPRKSVANMSPTKALKHKPSVSKLRLEELYNPVTSPATPQFSDLDINGADSVSSMSSDSLGDPKQTRLSFEAKQEIWRKCNAAVKNKIDCELAKIAKSQSSSKPS